MRADPVFALAQVAVLVKIILTVVVFDPRSIDSFSLPKSVAAHVMSLVVAALVLWLVARHGRSVLSWSPMHVGVGALLLAFALATPLALDPTVALFGVYRRYLGLTQMLDNVALYFAVAVLFRDLRSLRLLGVVGIGVAVPVLAYALIQRLGLDPFTFVQASTIIPISTLGNPDLVGGFVSVLGITALGLAVLLPGPAMSPYRGGLVLIALACTGILYVTAVRAGLLALLAGWAAVVLIALLTPGLARTRRVALVAVTLLLALGAVVSPLRARLSPEYLAGDLAVAGRLTTWAVAIDATKERPVLGLGPDNFAVVYPARRAESSLAAGTLENSTHDLWLYLATSSGVAGLAAMVLLLALALRASIGSAKRHHPAAYALIPIAAYLGQSLVNVNEIVLDWPLWVSLGSIAGATSVPMAAPLKVRRSATATGVVALALATLVATFGIAPRLLAGEAMLTADAFSAAGRAKEVLPDGEISVRLDPRRAEAWQIHGSTLFRAGNATAAVSVFGVAAELQPWQPTAWTNLAAAWAAIGNLDAAYAAAQRGTSADPYDATARRIVSELAYRRADYARSAAEGEKAIAYGASGADSYFTTISAYSQLKQFDRAESLARTAVDLFGTAQLRLQYAAILADLGKRAEAIAVLDALLKEQPDNADARQLKDALTAK